MATPKAASRNGTTKSNRLTTTRTLARTPKQTSKTASSPEQQAEAILKNLDRLVQQKFGVKLQRRNQRLAKKVYYAAREKFGADITRQTNKENKAAWKLWNQKVFVALFGTEQKPAAPEVIALVTSLFYDTIPDAQTDMEGAIAALVEENRRSLARRNERDQEVEDELDDEDEDLEDEDEDEEEDEDDEDEEEDEDDEDEDEDEDDD